MNLTDEERDVIRLTIGLLGQRFTQVEAAAVLPISQPTVSRAKARAMAKYRAALRIVPKDQPSEVWPGPRTRPMTEYIPDAEALYFPVEGGYRKAEFARIVSQGNKRKAEPWFAESKRAWFDKGGYVPDLDDHGDPFGPRRTAAGWPSSAGLKEWAAPR